MKIIKTILYIALLGFLITLNVYAIKEPKTTLHDIIYNWRILFWGLEAFALLSFTHMKSYLYAKKRLINKGKDKKEVQEALDVLNKDNLDNDN